MRLDSDDFELFGLPRRFALDAEALDARRRVLQAEVHPDRFAAQGAAAQRVAMQWAVRVNEAWRRLKDPVARATLLCELAGAKIDAERNTAMPPAFLRRQLEWRESLDDASDAAAVQALVDEVQASRAESLERLRLQLDENGDVQAAAAEVRGLMFVDRFLQSLDDRLAAIEEG
jgi:molecular chaperone HscB